ncbi:MAG: hypothetical protein FJ100_04100 [Deltaproteobacteria bacterium]|nr:hypothetical protein [Deltaproteobacteria bacterium]
MNSTAKSSSCPGLAVVASALFVYTLGGCGDGAASGDGSNGAGGAAGGWFSDESQDAGASDSSGAKSDAGGLPAKDTAAPPPPEKEPEADFGAPESSPNFVYIPATDADRLVRISGASLAVSLIEVSAQPTRVKVLPNDDIALVLHRGADELAVVRSTEAGDQVTTLPILPHCNALVLDAAGKHAIAWYDHATAKPGDPVGSLQAVSLVRIAAGKDAALSLSTGFRPRSVTFTSDGSKALVVTDDGISIIGLATAQDGDIVPPVAVTDKPLTKVDREVQLTDDGLWALAREANSTEIAIVYLPSKKLVTLAMPATPTDLDLVPKGGGALLVLRDAQLVAHVTLPSAATESFPVKLAPLGDLFAGLARLTDDGKTAVLYTSIAGTEQVGVLALGTGTVQPVAIKKTVDNVLLVTGSRKAVLMHKPAPGPGYNDPAEKFVDDAHGYTLLDLDTGYTKLVITPVKPTEVAFSAAPVKAWFLLPDSAGLAHALQGAAMDTFLTADHPLGSKPEHARYLPMAGVVAVTQSHPSGRVTFVNAVTGLAKTVTGYELNGKVK